MSWFRDLPLSRKLLVMTLTTSATALVLAALGFLAWDITRFRLEVTQDTEAQASIITDNSVAPLTFGDNRAADETLAVLRLRPRVVLGCLYAQDGSLFASFHRDRETACPAQPPGTSEVFVNRYDVVAPVARDRTRIGTLYIRRDLSDLYARLRVGLGAVAGFLVVAFLAALIIASRLQRSIVTPLLQLADTARAISSGRDYSLRAESIAHDEVGVVIRAFNDMLDRVAERNTALSHANADLEREVQERRRAEGERTAALERERDANRLKDEFLATLSHELRTPLNAVLGWTRLLRSAQVEPPTQTRALESIERNALAQARLIEDLLEISRIVTGKLRIQVRDVDLAAIIDAATEVVQPAAQARRIQLLTEVSVRPALASGDPDRLQQVVWNLLSNAVKFTPENGQVRIRLDAEDGFRLTVSDTGQGIDPRFLPHMFEPFRQADGSASREHGGLGLGLAIAKQLVELHGGTIEALSQGKGLGATFIVRLPALRQSVTVTPRVPFTTDAPRPDTIDRSLLRDLNVLVVDDEEDARLLLATTLEHYGAQVKTAPNASAALSAIAREAPDVLLSDIGMPHEDGFTLIKRVRALPGRNGGTIPAVAITAYASERDQREALAAGYQAHIAKPFDATQLTALVAHLGRAARPGELE